MTDKPNTTFTDLRGDSWSLVVTYGHRQKVLTETGVDLWTLFDNDLENLAQFVTNYPKVVEVTACLCSEEMDRRNIDAADFGYRMGGDTLEAAAEAIVQATVNFFPETTRREAIRGTWDRLKKVQLMMLKEVPRAAFEKWDQKDWQSELRGWSGKLAASLDSTPTHSP